MVAAGLGGAGLAKALFCVGLGGGDFFTAWAPKGNGQAKSRHSIRIPPAREGVLLGFMMSPITLILRCDVHCRIKDGTRPFHKSYGGMEGIGAAPTDGPVLGRAPEVAHFYLGALSFLSNRAPLRVCFLRETQTTGLSPRRFFASPRIEKVQMLHSIPSRLK